MPPGAWDEPPNRSDNRKCYLAAIRRSEAIGASNLSSWASDAARASLRSGHGSRGTQDFGVEQDQAERLDAHVFDFFLDRPEALLGLRELRQALAGSRSHEDRVLAEVRRWLVPVMNPSAGTPNTFCASAGSSTCSGCLSAAAVVVSSQRFRASCAASL